MGLGCERKGRRGEGEGLEGGKGNYRWRGAWPRTEGIDWMREGEGWDTGPESVGFRFRTESALGLKRTGGGSKKKASDWQAAER